MEVAWRSCRERIDLRAFGRLAGSRHLESCAAGLRALWHCTLFNRLDKPYMYRDEICQWL